MRIVILAAILLAGFGVPLACLLVIRRRQLARLRSAGVQEVPIEVRRRTAVAAWGGAGVGLVVAVISAVSGTLGRGLLLAAPLFGLCVVLGVLVGELSVGAPRTGTRRAEMSVRRVRDYLPRVLTPIVAGTSGVLAILLAATTLIGSPDDLGRSGRWLVSACRGSADGALSSSNGPWPGSYYSAPLALLLLAGFAAASLALTRIARRPRPGDPQAIAQMDDVLRGRAATIVIGSCGVLVTIPLVGVSLVSGAALVGNDCGPDWWGPAGAALLLLIPLWVVILGWSLAAVLVPLPAIVRPVPERVS